MTDYYIGQVGIMPDVFWRCTWNEAQLLAEAYHIKQNLEWERCRYIATMLYNTKVDKKHKMINPEKLFKLPQDFMKKERIRKNLPSPEDTRKFAQKVSSLKNIKVWKKL